MLMLSMVTLASTLSVEPLAPAWFVVPVGFVTLIVLAGHLLSLRNVPMPASRVRIRVANSVLMFIGTLMLMYSLAYVPPSDGRRFVLCWMAVGAMVVVVLVLAWVDVFNNMRLARIERVELVKKTAAQLRLTRGET
jgi:hypothetical protein